MCVCVCGCQLLAEGLCAKHGLELSDFTPHTESQPDEAEKVDEGEEKKTATATDNGIVICSVCYILIGTGIIISIPSQYNITGCLLGT